MSSKTYADARGISTENEEAIRSGSYTDGTECMLNYRDACEKQCVVQGTNCWNCLASSTLCPLSDDPTQPCCPYAELAVNSSNCLSRNGDNVSACLSTSSPIIPEWAEILMYVVGFM